MKHENLINDIIKTAVQDVYPEHYKTELFKHVFDKGMVKTLKDLADICDKEATINKKALDDSVIEQEKGNIRTSIKMFIETKQILLDAASKVFKTGLV